MKLLIITNSLSSGGAEKQSILLANLLSEYYDVRLWVLSSSQGTDTKLKNLLQENKYIVRYTEGGILLGMHEVIENYLRWHPDVSISFLAKSNIINAVLGGFFSVKNKIGGIRNAFIPRGKLRVQKYIHNFFLTWSVANNYASLSMLEKAGFNTKKVSVIHNYQPSNLADRKSKTNNKIKFLTVGRFVYQKDYPLLLRAFALAAAYARNQGKEIYLTIVGYGPLESEIKFSLEDLKIESIVEVVVNPDNLVCYFERSNVYLSTSHFEGLSNSIMEAMSFSLPVIATDVGDNAFLVENGVNGFILKSRSPEDISNLMIEFVNSPYLIEHMGIKSYEKIMRGFGKDRFLADFRKIIENG
jgi:glycosyltransferase involved in cell wall biosynthesis